MQCPLYYRKPHELCIAVILSAQCTDEQVNKITPTLFEKFPELNDYAEADTEAIEALVHSTGFFRNKAKNIQGFCKAILKDHAGQIPQTLKELTALPGVGRKTANVILQELYGIPSGVVVDTHVSRISRLFHFTQSKNPEIIERDLKEILPEKCWIQWSLYLIFLGRNECTARRKFCERCDLNKLCPSAFMDFKMGQKP